MLNSKTIIVLITLTLSVTFVDSAFSETSSKPGSKASTPSGDVGVAGSGTAIPNLFTGIMEYTYPIEVPAGRHETQPSLSIKYNSSNSNGWIGVGWDIEVPAIERNLNGGLAYDGEGNGYILRIAGTLINLVSVGNNEYRAKIEDAFLKVVKTANIDGSPQSWEVYDKSGTHYTFGKTAYDNTGVRPIQSDPDNSNKVFKWCLDKVEDTNGNYITYSYWGDNNQVYLKQIDYTGNSNASVAPTNTIKFHLEGRTDAQNTFTQHFAVKIAYRLKSIEIIANGNPVRFYQLNYDYSTDSGRSILTAIQQFGKDAELDANTWAVTSGTSLPAQQFQYSSESSNFSCPSSGCTPAGSFGGGSSNDFFVDLNGDGLVDIVSWGGSAGWQVMENKGNYNFACPTSGCSVIGTFGGGPSNVFFVDVNGDGLVDIVGWGGSSGWQVMENKGNYNFACPASGCSVIGTFGGSASNVQFVDLNGDGLVDIVGWGGSSGWQIMENKGNYNFACPASGCSVIGTFGGSASNVQFVDLNGDGLADVVAWDGTGWQMLENKGNYNFACPSSGCNFLGPVGDPASSARFIDTNGDGLADLVASSTIPHAVFIEENKGNYSFACPLTGCVVTGTSTDGGRYADIDGRGLLDVVTWYSGNGWNFQKRNGMVSDLLTTVFNGIGGTTSIQYRPASAFHEHIPFPIQIVDAITVNDGNNITSSVNYSYSGGYYHGLEKDFRGFNYVKLSGSVGPAGEQKNTEIWFHQGNDVSLDVNAPQVSDGYMKGKPYRIRVSEATGAVYSETTIGYGAASSTAPFVTFPIQKDIYTCDGKLGTNCAGNNSALHVKTIFGYDDYGNITTEFQYGDLRDSMDDRTIFRSYSYNLSSWILNKPASESICQGIASGGCSQIVSAKYFYDTQSDCTTSSSSSQPIKGNLTCIARWVDGTSNDPSIRLTYDNFGNLVETRDQKANPPTTIQYDDLTHTYPTIITDSMGFSTQAFYYQGLQSETGLYGQVKSAKDLANNTETSFEYDKLGRITKTTTPEASFTLWSYINIGRLDTSSDSQHITVTSGQRNSFAGLSSTTYFDGIGRTIRTSKTGTDNKLVWNQVKYNSTGTIYQKSVPYFETWPQIYSQYTYDPMGRVLNISNADGTTSSYCYANGVLVSIDPNRHRKRATTNAQGKLIKVEEYLGTYNSCTTDQGSPYATTIYGYDVLGNLVSITDAEGHQTNIGYDSLSRKKWMVDPDMGSWTYTYDKNGNLQSETDALSRTIRYRYDALNRVIYKDYPTAGTPVVTYTYDEAWSSYAKGRLTTMSDASGTTKYYYDNMGRPQTTSKNIDGSNYSFFEAYDSLGRIATISYPDGEIIDYSYNGSALASVTNRSGYVYASFGNYIPRGNPINAYYGTNGSAGTLYYQRDYAANRPQSMTFTGTTGRYIDVNYSYDNIGNVTGITDNITSSRSQTFIYDDLDRLIQAQSTAYGVASYMYDQIGNISLRQTGAGTTCPSGYTLQNGVCVKADYGPTNYIECYWWGGDPGCDNPSLWQDSCNGDVYSEFSCPAGTNMTCNDNTNWDTDDADYFFWDYRTVTCSSTNPTPTPITYLYSPQHVHGVAQTSDGLTYSYDANGNMTSDGTRSISYDYNNMPTTITRNNISTNFAYDGQGNRAKKIGTSSSSIYIGNLYQCIAGVCTKYIFANGELIADKTGSSITYYHADHISSTRIVTDANGNKIEDIFYYPFGEAQSDTGSLSVTHKYTSQEFDIETGLYNYNARLYNPALGKFISADSIVPNYADPQLLNRYSYVRNCPSGYIDPTGHNFRDYLDRVSEKVRSEIDRAAQRHTYNSYVINFLVDPTLGHYMIGRTDEGRKYIGGEIIVASAVATWYCAGCGAAAAGALIGEIAGGISAERSHGDMLNGVLVGGVVGGVTGYLGGLASVNIEDESVLLADVVEGAIRGFGIGVATGYAGGNGDMSTMLSNGLNGAISGGIVGGLTPYASDIFQQIFSGKSFFSAETTEALMEALMVLKVPFSGVASGLLSTPIPNK